MSLEQGLGPRLQHGIKKNEPMSLHTSWQVGGPADYFLVPSDRSELVEILKYNNRSGSPLFAFGNGTNLLVRDGGIRGLVVQIGSSFHYVNREGSSLKAGAGTPMPYLARFAARNGLAGLEFAGGIPGTLAGALVMNAGAFGNYIGNAVQTVTVVRPDGEIYSLGRAELEFGYRRSNLPGRGIIVEAELALSEGDAAELEGRVDIFLDERNRRHPRLPSAGSVFRNLPDRPAGRLIEAAGCKGMRVGGAQVSEQHANFIINRGGATASDILNLIENVRRQVKEKFKVELHLEVMVVGEER